MSKSSINVRDVGNGNESADTLNITSHLVRNMISINQDTNQLLMDLAERANVSWESMQKYADNVQGVRDQTEKVIDNLEMVKTFKDMDPSFKGFLGPVYQVLIDMAEQENRETIPKLEGETNNLGETIDQLREEARREENENRHEDHRRPNTATTTTTTRSSLLLG